jgi:hypothetical protein
MPLLVAMPWLAQLIQLAMPWLAQLIDNKGINQ